MNDLPASASYVSLKSLAAELGMDRSHARRYVLNLGITPAKRRTADSGGQLTLMVSAAEAELVRNTRTERGFAGAQSAVENEAGFFYLIQLVPEAIPNRVKIGIADSVEKRLAEHRTAAPTAKLLKSWPCKRSWDYAAMDSITRNGSSLS